MKSTCIAPSNIALVKYWGKRDQALMLPQNGSISMTLSALSTETSVDFRDDLEADRVWFKGEILTGKKADKVSAHLDLIRQQAGISTHAEVNSTANFPMGAGLASSASGFAALTVAGAKAAGLNLSERELSILARRGSGSAARSVPAAGGFVEWCRGVEPDGSDSYAESIRPAEDDFGLCIVVAVLTEQEKSTGSTAGMAQTVATSPFYPAWLETIEADLDRVRAGILAGNFRQVASTAEANALKMHCTAITTDPAILYWEPSTVRLMKQIWQWRAEGLEVYFTIDGGPQVKLLCREHDVSEVTSLLSELEEVLQTIVCEPGRGAKLL